MGADYTTLQWKETPNPSICRRGGAREMQLSTSIGMKAKPEDQPAKQTQ